MSEIDTQKTLIAMEKSIQARDEVIGKCEKALEKLDEWCGPNGSSMSIGAVADSCRFALEAIRALKK